MAEAEVKRKLGLTEEEIKRGGYRIVTTFDKSAIDAGIAAVQQELPKRKPKHLQIGLTAIDPKTGAVRAIYGGSDFLKRQRNAATQDRVEAAGTFSTFTLLAALKVGVPLAAPLDGGTPQKIGGQEIRNYRAKQYGEISLLDATVLSVNTAFAQLNERIGAERTQAAAFAAGIPKSPEVDASVTNVLGTASLRPIDLAGAYATIAAEGVKRTPFVVQSVTRIDSGVELFRMDSSRTKGKQVLDPQAAANTSLALQFAVLKGTAAYAAQLRRPVAGQTGTSASSRSAWFVGYTPQLATAVSMYQLSPDGKDVVRMEGFGKFKSIFGGGYPTRIWTNFMAEALSGQPVQNLPRARFETIAPEPQAPGVDEFGARRRPDVSTAVPDSATDERLIKK
jgi:membrane peptidoglycan carboxypeptidase